MTALDSTIARLDTVYGLFHTNDWTYTPKSLAPLDRTFGQQEIIVPGSWDK